MTEHKGRNESEGAAPGPARGYAGDYLKTEPLVELLGPLPAGMLAGGMLAGVALAVSFGSGSAAIVATTILVVSLACWWWRRHRRNDLRKGHTAERQVGRALEQAVTAEGCAVAHNVTAIMDSGDIDHIVATPQKVWVIETKYRRVPENRFPKVLSRLHECRARVQAVLPPGTPVQACLVLAYEESGVQAIRDGIRVYNNDRFRHALLPSLKEERLGPGEVDAQVAAVVWRLSRGEAVADVPRTGEPPLRGRRASAQSDATNPVGPTGKPPKAYKRWTTADDRELMRLSEAGWDRKRLAEHFGRRPNAIRRRVRKLLGD